MYKFPNDITSFAHLCLLSALYVFTLIYAIKNWKISLYHKLICLYFILLSYCITVSGIVLNNFLAQFPHLSRTGFIPILLFNPIFYFAIEKGILKKQRSIKDLLHFIPAILYIINFIPFFIQSKAEKISLIKENTVSGFSEGWFIPKYFIPLIVANYMISYSASIYKEFITKELKTTSSDIQTKVKAFWAFNSFHILPIFMLLLGFHEGVHRGSYNLIYIVGLTIFLIYFFLDERIFNYRENPIEKNPYLDTDLSISTAKSFELQETSLIKKQLNDFKQKVIKNQQKMDKLTRSQRIELRKMTGFMSKNAPFLKESFSQQSFAKDLGISNESIRTILHVGYNMTFSEYKNYFRIMYLVEQITNNSIWIKYSIDDISKELGYKTPNSLYINCKKFTGLTPRQLLEELQ